MIYTSYFANVKSLPSEVIPIAICGGVPEWWCGLQYRKLAPKKELQNVYSTEVDKSEYPEFDVWIYDMLKSGVFVRKEK